MASGRPVNQQWVTLARQARGLTQSQLAARAGLRTAHIARPNEHGPGRGETAASVPVDFSAVDLGALAEQLR